MKKVAFSVLATGSLALLIGVSDAEASSYTIKPGDSLWKIASENNVSVANIKQWNNLKSDLIYPKQTIKLTGSTASTSKPASNSSSSKSATDSTSTYIVKSGDTLSRIANQHKTSVSAIQKLNSISGHLIYPGQKLKVSGSAAESAPQTSKPAEKAPAASAPSASSRTHKVVSGDTLSAIAYRNGISVTQLMNWNGLSSSLIRIGQVLKIENAAGASQPSTKPVSKPAENASGTVGKILSTANSLTGVPYVWGGSTASGFDCSGFIYYVYNKAGVSVPRTNTTGYDARSYDVSTPQAGDLVFFKNTYRSGISHMGIYIGDNKFIHAGGDHVQISSVNSGYWGQHFDSFKRLYAMD